MPSTPVYNGVRAKQLNQINRHDGEACVAYSAPDFFIKDESAFAPKRSGNQAQFFTTGEDYFKDLADAIGQAERCIFITGWQVNYDVLLDGQRTLWQCLYQALTSKPQLRVYVMPWLSPSSSVGTYDIETMLAVFQLNAGLDGGPRAFCTPAIQRSDMNGLGAAFSHHQKSVVIDNRLGYVGGIDLAYGRRDDNNFSLDPTDRQGNDAYNPGVPKLGWMEMDKHVSRTGLIMAALFDLSKPAIPGPLPMPSRAEIGNSINYILDFFKGPPLPLFEAIQQRGERLGDALEQGRRKIAELKYAIMERSIRTIAELIEQTLDDEAVDPRLKERLREWLSILNQTTGNLSEALRIQSTHLIHMWLAETEVGRVFAMLSNASFDSVPASVIHQVNELSTSVMWSLYGILQAQARSNQAPFPYLLEYPQPVASSDNSCLGADQPRMPWQDVHCSIKGPSVYDLSRNFIDRWNGQQAYLANSPPPQDTAVGIRVLEAIMTWLNRLIRSVHLHHFLDARSIISINWRQPTPVWINTPQAIPHYPERRSGGVSVQVLRSAGTAMLRQEQVGRSQAGVQLPALQGLRATASRPIAKAPCCRPFPALSILFMSRISSFKVSLGRKVS